jgi:hypothetical protein
LSSWMAVTLDLVSLCPALPTKEGSCVFKHVIDWQYFNLSTMYTTIIVKHSC